MDKKKEKGKAGKKAAVNETPIRIPVKSVWDEVLEKDALEEKKRNARNFPFV